MAIASADLVGRAVWDDVRGAAIAVLGIGRSGVAAANALAHRGADVIAYDDRPEAALGSAGKSLDRRIRLRCGGGYVAREGEICVISPGIASWTATYRRARASALSVISEVELFYRLNRAANGGMGNPIIAISGTDGKTTTAMMIAHILQTAGRDMELAGNIGTPLCEILDQLAPSAWIVAELSAFQLATCSLLRPRVAVLTNIADDHHDWFGGDKESYARAKRAVADRCGVGDTIVVNADDPQLDGGFWPRSAATLSRYSAAGSDGAQTLLAGGSIVTAGPGGAGAGGTVALMHRDALGADGGQVLPGNHNVENALAAAAACLAIGIGAATVVSALRSFTLPAHRLQMVGSIGDVRFIDDSKATNPHAAIAGLKAIELAEHERLVWIGGGSEKDADFTEIAAEVARRACAAVLIGATRDRLAASLPAQLPVEQCDGMHEAVAAACRLAQPRGVVLLSPACASFGLFRDFAHRGEVFCAAVAALGRASAQS